MSSEAPQVGRYLALPAEPFGEPWPDVARSREREKSLHSVETTGHLSVRVLGGPANRARYGLCRRGQLRSRGRSGRVELSLVGAEALQDVLARVTAPAIEPPRGIADEAFGRFIVLEDPDGSAVQVNEQD